MLRAYVNYPNRRISVHHTGCGAIRKGRKDGQRCIQITPASLSSELQRFNMKAYSLGANAAENDCGSRRTAATRRSRRRSSPISIACSAATTHGWTASSPSGIAERRDRSCSLLADAVERPGADLRSPFAVVLTHTCRGGSRRPRRRLRRAARPQARTVIVAAFDAIRLGNRLLIAAIIHAGLLRVIGLSGGAPRH